MFLLASVELGLLYNKNKKCAGLLPFILKVHSDCDEQHKYVDQSCLDANETLVKRRFSPPIVVAVLEVGASGAGVIGVV